METIMPKISELRDIRQLWLQVRVNFCSELDNVINQFILYFSPRIVTHENNYAKISKLLDIRQLLLQVRVNLFLQQSTTLTNKLAVD